MKKICIIIDTISNSGGTDRVLSMLSNSFTSRGNEVTVFSLNGSQPYYKIDSNVKIVTSNYKRRFCKLLDIVANIKKEQFDINLIISMGRLSTQIIPLLKLFNVKGTIVCSDHVSIESFSLPIRLLKYCAYKFADKVVVLTNSDREFLGKVINQKKISVIRNMSPYESVTMAPDGLENKKKVVLAVGRLTYQKNFQRLLSLWHKIDSGDWLLRIIGDGEDFSELSVLKEKYHLMNVEFLGAKNNLEPNYRESSILVMTSRYEGLPMVLIEAKNFGIPAISFNCKTGPSEIITNDGFLISYDDDDDFIRKVKLLLNDPNKINRMGYNALKNSKKYSEESIYYEWIKVFDF